MAGSTLKPSTLSTFRKYPITDASVAEVQVRRNAVEFTAVHAILVGSV